MKAGDERLRFGRYSAEEPLFILRAQDQLAAEVVRYWATLAEANGVRSGKVRDARRLADDMDSWPTRKKPD
jgi:hypothetical protein